MNVHRTRHRPLHFHCHRALGVSLYSSTSTRTTDMAALYRDPHRNWGHISVTEADPDLDEPPAPDEGKVARVYMEHTYTCPDRHWNRCQMCPVSVCKAYPHIMAVIHQFDRIGVRCRRAYFCSPECLGAWAGRSGKPAGRHR